jgi:hypothetical protein
MTTRKLIKFFENQDFKVHTFEQDDMLCAEIEKWTDGGVDMIISLMPFSKEEFIKYVLEQFDIDEEIELHRQDQQYKSVFTIKMSLKDFTDFYYGLKEVVIKLQEMKVKTVDLVIPECNCKNGAPHGRGNVGVMDETKKVYDCLVPMFNDGYDKGYAYWGYHPQNKRLRVKYHKDLTYIDFYWH